MKKRAWKGSYTVEAAMILSITIFILGAFIITAFFVHDRAVLECSACEAAAAGSNFFKAKDRSTAAEKAKKQMKSQRLLGSKNLAGYAATGNKESTASWNCVYPVPGFAMKYLKGGQLNIKASFSCMIHDPADAIRKIRGAGELLIGGES